ncbi:MAG: hypothetical protein VW600_16795, partial [Ferrovibrio sp.]
VNERRAALAQRDVLEKAILAKSAKTLTIDEKLRANNDTVANASEEAVARARLATRFVNGWDKTNPFAGLSREELNAIVFDETRSYTTNEQRAAFAELKQYLPASAIPADSAAKTDTKKTDTKSSSGSTKTTDPYNTQGAYSKYMLQQLQRANNTSYLLGLMGGGSGFGLASYLRA